MLKIYNRPLSTSEMTDLYNEMTPIPQNNTNQNAVNKVCTNTSTIFDPRDS